MGTSKDRQCFVAREFGRIGWCWTGSNGCVGLLVGDIANAPNTTAGSIAIRVIQWDFIVPDDFVVKVCDIEATIGSKLQIDGSEPRVIAGEQIGHFDGLGRGTEVLESVSIDAASHHIATEKIGLKV